MPVMPGPFIGAAHVRDPTAGHRGFIVPLHHQQPHPVGELLLDDRHFLALNSGHNPEQDNQ